MGEFIVEDDPEYEEARLNERRQRARRLAGEGYSAELTAKYTGLTVEQINAIWDEATEARAEGYADARFEIARHMLADGMDAAVVSDCTALSEAEVRALPEAVEEG